ncbi:hypothetical protein THAOC_20097, partial [Thalassiosira oceanica]
MRTEKRAVVIGDRRVAFGPPVGRPPPPPRGHSRNDAAARREREGCPARHRPPPFSGPWGPSPAGGFGPRQGPCTKPNEGRPNLKRDAAVERYKPKIFNKPGRPIQCPHPQGHLSLEDLGRGVELATWEASVETSILSSVYANKIVERSRLKRFRGPGKGAAFWCVAWLAEASWKKWMGSNPVQLEDRLRTVGTSKTSPENWGPVEDRCADWPYPLMQSRVIQGNEKGPPPRMPPVAVMDRGRRDSTEFGDSGAWAAPSRGRRPMSAAQRSKIMSLVASIGRPYLS